MSVSALGGVIGAGAAAAAGAATSSTNDSEENFMKMLIAQLRNQDPLNPMDNSQMTSQLAQLNMVSGINQLNKTMNGLVSNDTNSQALSAASLLGREVLVPGNGLQLSNGSGKFGFDLTQAVDALSLTVYDAQGNAIHSRDLGPQAKGLQTLAWDGATDSGVAATDGSYVFKLNAQLAGEEIPVTALTAGSVQNISLNSGVLKAHVGKAGDVSLGDIKQIF